MISFQELNIESRFNSVGSNIFNSTERLTYALFSRQKMLDEATPDYLLNINRLSTVHKFSLARIGMLSLDRPDSDLRSAEFIDSPLWKIIDTAKDVIKNTENGSTAKSHSSLPNKEEVGIHLFGNNSKLTVGCYLASRAIRSTINARHMLDEVTIPNNKAKRSIQSFKVLGMLTPTSPGEFNINQFLVEPSPIYAIYRTVNELYGDPTNPSAQP